MPAPAALDNLYTSEKKQHVVETGDGRTPDLKPVLTSAGLGVETIDITPFMLPGQAAVFGRQTLGSDWSGDARPSLRSALIGLLTNHAPGSNPDPAYSQGYSKPYSNSSSFFKALYPVVKAWTALWCHDTDALEAHQRTGGDRPTMTGRNRPATTGHRRHGLVFFPAQQVLTQEDRRRRFSLGGAACLVDGSSPGGHCPYARRTGCGWSP